MSKLATDRVREMLSASGDYFIQDLLKEAQGKIKEVVMDRMRVFGSASACSLPGNICPTGGSCATCSACNTHAKPAAAPLNETSSREISAAELSDIVTRVISNIMKKN